LVPCAEAWPRLIEARDEVGRMLRDVNSSSSSSSVDATMGTTDRGVRGTTIDGGVGGFTSMDANAMASMMRGISGSGGLGDLDSSIMRDMLSDPNALRNIAGMINVSYFFYSRLRRSRVYSFRHTSQGVVRPPPFFF
jgi:hypothetical protein